MTNRKKIIILVFLCSIFLLLILGLPKDLAKIISSFSGNPYEEEKFIIDASNLIELDKESFELLPYLESLPHTKYDNLKTALTSPNPNIEVGLRLINKDLIDVDTANDFISSSDKLYLTGFAQNNQIFLQLINNVNNLPEDDFKIYLSDIENKWSLIAGYSEEERERLFIELKTYGAVYIIGEDSVIRAVDDKSFGEATSTELEAVYITNSGYRRLTYLPLSFSLVGNSIVNQLDLSRITVSRLSPNNYVIHKLGDLVDDKGGKIDLSNYFFALENQKANHYQLYGMIPIELVIGGGGSSPTPSPSLTPSQAPTVAPSTRPSQGGGGTGHTNCGNGVVDSNSGLSGGIPEECDGGPYCGPDCKFIAYCGDGKLDAGEQCDEGGANGMLGGTCDGNCKKVIFTPPTPEETPTATTTATESSSPTVDPTPSVESTPSVEPSIEPSIEPSVEPSAPPTQDPTIEPSSEPSVEPSQQIITHKECSNGRCVDVAGEGANTCSDDYICDWLYRFQTPTYTPEPSPSVSESPFASPSETPTIDVRTDTGGGGGGGASSPSPEWSPSPEVSATPIGCGDKNIDAATETCDDGNTNDGDGCNSDCKLEAICGNLYLEAGEECDDGNNMDGDGCDSSCRIVVCGNGRIEGNENCDDGNTTNGDGCSTTCYREEPSPSPSPSPSPEESPSPSPEESPSPSPSSKYINVCDDSSGAPVCVTKKAAFADSVSECEPSDPQSCQYVRTCQPKDETHRRSYCGEPELRGMISTSGQNNFFECSDDSHCQNVYKCNGSGQCVESIPTETGQVSTCDPNDEFSCKYLRCSTSDGSCELTNKTGEQNQQNECSQATGDSPSNECTHYACSEDLRCQVVIGKGNNECTSLSGQYISNQCGHLECSDTGTCEPVAGAGKDQCKDSNECVHYECNKETKKCDLYAGKANSTCDPNSDDCKESHLACIDFQCVGVPGAGEDTCSADGSKPTECYSKGYTYCSTDETGAPACKYAHGTDGKNECNDSKDCKNTSPTETPSSTASPSSSITPSPSPSLEESPTPSETVSSSASATPSETVTEIDHCGNGKKEEELGEECDLGKGNGGAFCSMYCTNVYRCGNGIKEGDEECDWLNYDNTKRLKCAVDCTYIYPSNAPTETPTPTPTIEPTCGNGDIDEDEDCDGPSANAICQDINIDLLCNSECKCEKPNCKNGKLEPGHECDSAQFSLFGDDYCKKIKENAGAYCDDYCQCSIKNPCGNKILDKGEDCEIGVATLACPGIETCKDCKCVQGDLCSNGIIEEGSECDSKEGSGLGDNRCKDLKKNSLAYCEDCECRTDETCGNNKLDQDEQCDSSNPEYSNNYCKSKLGKDNAQCVDCQCEEILTLCGNTKIDNDEQCDDGNQADGDGCDSNCKKECGNGQIDLNEECDDQNKIDNDECTNACKNNTCCICEWQDNGHLACDDQRFNNACDSFLNSDACSRAEKIKAPVQSVIAGIPAIIPTQWCIKNPARQQYSQCAKKAIKYEYNGHGDRDTAAYCVNALFEACVSAESGNLPPKFLNCVFNSCSTVKDANSIETVLNDIHSKYPWANWSVVGAPQTVYSNEQGEYSASICQPRLKYTIAPTGLNVTGELCSNVIGKPFISQIPTNGERETTVCIDDSGTSCPVPGGTLPRKTLYACIVNAKNYLGTYVDHREPQNVPAIWQEKDCPDEDLLSITHLVCSPNSGLCLNLLGEGEDECTNVDEQCTLETPTPAKPNVQKITNTNNSKTTKNKSAKKTKGKKNKPKNKTKTKNKTK